LGLPIEIPTLLRPLDVSAIDDTDIGTENTAYTAMAEQSTDGKDYAAGYVFIVEKLKHIESLIASSDKPIGTNPHSNDINDIKSMVIDIGHKVGTKGSTIKVLEGQLSTMSDRMQSMSDTMNTLILVGKSGMNLSDDSTVETGTSKSALHTRRVTSVVPACIIRSMWYSKNNTDMPVSMDYLRKLCDAVFPPIDGELKSKLGMVLRLQIDNHEDNVNIGNDMVLVLSQGSDVSMADARRCMIQTMKLLGTTYAFMLPKTMSTMLSKVNVITGGTVVWL
jgi:hypothetical protein